MRRITRQEIEKAVYCAGCAPPCAHCHGCTCPKTTGRFVELLRGIDAFDDVRTVDVPLGSVVLRFSAKDLDNLSSMFGGKVLVVSDVSLSGNTVLLFAGTRGSR